VKKAFAVGYSPAASDDLLRMFEFLVTRAQTLEDLDLCQRAVDALRFEIEERLSRTPLIYRKAADNPFLRELIVAFGASGYVVQYEIEGMTGVNILAVRHQREDDYH
jgi:plasmid stabilization system protein ParE